MAEPRYSGAASDEEAELSDGSQQDAVYDDDQPPESPPHPPTRPLRGLLTPRYTPARPARSGGPPPRNYPSTPGTFQSPTTWSNYSHQHTPALSPGSATTNNWPSQLSSQPQVGVPTKGNAPEARLRQPYEFHRRKGSSASPPGTVLSERPSKRARRTFHATPGDAERLDPRYRRRPPDFFRVGRVFSMLHTEPMGGQPAGSNQAYEDAANTSARGAPSSVSSHVSRVQYGEEVFSKIRWFIVIRQGNGASQVVPISTYNNQGVAKRGVVKQEHAIAYTPGHYFGPTKDEEAEDGETPMYLRAIAIKPDDTGAKLERMSRIDYGRVYNVEHYVKAMAFGWVRQESIGDLHSSFNHVFKNGCRSRSPLTQFENTARGSLQTQMQPAPQTAGPSMPRFGPALQPPFEQRPPPTTLQEAWEALQQQQRRASYDNTPPSDPRRRGGGRRRTDHDIDRESGGQLH